MVGYSVQEMLLSVSQVNFSLDGRPILQNVNATVHNIVRPGLNQGQVVALLGPSGVGKTQFFNLLSGLMRPDSGEVLVTGKLIPVQAGMVGVVSQGYTLFRHRTVLGNLVVAARARGFSGREASDRARFYLERFGLSDKYDAYPAELSGGQRQRIAIIQQLLSSEHFLLMDEPFSGLDPLMKDAVCRLIVEVASSDELSTLIITTHDIESAVCIADTIWLIGRDWDEKRRSLGARIKKIYDLAAMGLAWRPDIQSSQEFREVVSGIREDFQGL